MSLVKLQFIRFSNGRDQIVTVVMASLLRLIPSSSSLISIIRSLRFNVLTYHPGRTQQFSNPFT